MSPEKNNGQEANGWIIRKTHMLLQPTFIKAMWLANKEEVVGA